MAPRSQNLLGKRKHSEAANDEALAIAADTSFAMASNHRSPEVSKVHHLPEVLHQCIVYTSG